MTALLYSIICRYISKYSRLIHAHNEYHIYIRLTDKQQRFDIDTQLKLFSCIHKDYDYDYELCLRNDW